MLWIRGLKVIVGIWLLDIEVIHWYLHLWLLIRERTLVVGIIHRVRRKAIGRPKRINRRSNLVNWVGV